MIGHPPRRGYTRRPDILDGMPMPGKPTTSEEEVKELTAQFYVTLRAYVARLGPDAAARAPKAREEVDALLNGDPPTWSNAYQIEQLLVDLFDEPTLEVELQGRLLEAEAHLRPPLFEHYVQRAQAAKSPQERRALLARLLNDLQWRHTVNEVKRTYSKEVSKSTGLIFVATVVAFALMILLLRTLFSGADWRANPAVLLLLAAVTGGWGAGFSMLASLKSRLDAAGFDDLKLMKAKWILGSRPLIGVGAAGILFYFLVSGLLEGPVFPKLAVEPGTDIALKDLALMIVWCFVAGFSERLVPALLAKTEDRAGTPPADPMRFKPDNADLTQAGEQQQPPAAAGV